jgi:hypothetical protein
VVAARDATSWSCDPPFRGAKGALAMSDVNTFIDTLGRDISTAVVPEIERLAESVSQKAFTQYGPRIAEFAGQLAQDVIDEQSATVRDFAIGLIQEVFKRYQPDLAGELQTRLVRGGIEVTGRDVRLDVKLRDTGAVISSLDIPVSLVIKVDALGVTLQNATIDLDVIR